MYSLIMKVLFGAIIGLVFLATYLMFDKKKRPHRVIPGVFMWLLIFLLSWAFFEIYTHSVKIAVLEQKYYQQWPPDVYKHKNMSIQKTGEEFEI